MDQKRRRVGTKEGETESTRRDQEMWVKGNGKPRYSHAMAILEHRIYAFCRKKSGIVRPVDVKMATHSVLLRCARRARSEDTNLQRLVRSGVLHSQLES